MGQSWRKSGAILMAGMVMALGSSSGRAEDKKPAEKKKMNVVFAIDVSGSMDHIIEAAQKKVWAIVNDLMKAKPTPDLRVGLIAYHGENEALFDAVGFKIWDLTDDLDTMYKNLMSLHTIGGNRECVGRAMYEAVHTVKWDKGADVMKTLFIMGNEPADQDTNQKEYGFKVVAPQAIANGIIVNTVYCQQGQGLVERGWEEIAKLSEGVFTTIGLEGRVTAVATPFDKDLTELNGKLNQTFIGYGARGRDAMMLQARMDSTAEAQGAPMAAERAVTKAGAAYKTASWDLVKGLQEGQVAMKDLKNEELPEPMQKMNEKERETYVKQKS